MKSVAPFRSASSRCTLIKPPQLAVSWGVVPHGTLWGVAGVLYGLAESPGDWTGYRDQQLGAIEHPMTRPRDSLVRMLMIFWSQDQHGLSSRPWPNSLQYGSVQPQRSWMPKNSKLENIHLSTMKNSVFDVFVASRFAWTPMG